MNILVIRVGNIGDVLMATPFIRKVQGFFPGSLVDFVTSPHAVSSVVENPYIRKIFIYKKVKGLAGILKRAFLIQQLRLRAYGMVFVLEEHPQYKEFAFHVGPKAIKVGFAGEGDQWLDRKTAISYDSHVIENSLWFLKDFFGATIVSDDSLMDFFIPKETQEALKGSLSNWKGPEGKYFVLHPGCSEYLPLRRWVMPSYHQMVRFLRAQGYRVFLTGTKSDKLLIDEILNGCDPADRGIEIFLDRHLFDVAFLIKHASGVLSSDTGIMHVARAIQTPTVALFGPSNPYHTGCIGPGQYVQIRNDYRCGPCHYYPQYRLEDKKNCLDGQPPACMKSITVQQAVDGLNKILSHE